jgi:DNA helicase-2/ATP-dependent DNA helicase PcrA
VNLKRQLNTEQIQAVQHKEGPLLVVAGAGTGKTQVITYRIAELLKGGVQPSEILAITFTDKAAGEMESRIVDLLKQYLPDLRVNTFNAFGHELLERFGFEIGLGPPLRVLNSAQKIVFMRHHIDKLGLDYYAPVTRPDRFLAELAGYFSQVKNELITPENYDKFVKKLARVAETESEYMEAARQRELATVYRNYVQLARQENVLDFDDQLYVSVELLKKRPNVLNKLQTEIKYILVDEFQDTNPLQNKLINLLAGDKQNVMVVGDDDQSIYRFRGAAVANILSFKEEYPQAQQIALVQNYRSSQEVLDSAYRLIQHNNPNRLEAKYKINKRLIAQFRAKSPQIKCLANYEEEAAWIAADIKSRLKKGQDADNIAILMRKNQQSQLLSTYLENESINYMVIGQTIELFGQPEVKLLFTFMRVIADNADSTNLFHLLTSSIYSVSPLTLADYSSQARRRRINLEKILHTAIQEDQIDDKSVAKKLQQALEQIETWRAQIHLLSVGQLCHLFLKDTNYINSILQRAKEDPLADLKIANLNRFFTMLLDYERIAGDSSVLGFLDNLPVLATADQVPTTELTDLGTNKVKLLTVHKAKGLEFETVYIFDMVHGTFPARKLPSMLEIASELLPAKTTTVGDHQTEEERRLMYVAITRAKKDLILTYSLDHGGKQLKKPSQFLAESFDFFKPELPARGKTIKTQQIDLFANYNKNKKPLPASSFVKGGKLVLTARQVEDYLMCPAEFRLRHIIKPPQPPAFELEYGTLIHGAIQLYNRRKAEKNTVNLNEIIRFIESNWPNEGFISIGHQERGLKQALKTINHFFKREEKAKRHPKYIEYPFWFEVNGLEAQIHGRFDAVYEDGNGVEIRDYKTGASTITDRAKATKRTKASLQLGIYTLAWQQLKQTAVEVVSLDFVDSGLIGTDHKTDKQLQVVERKIEQAIEGIKGGYFKPGTSHIFCSHSEYGF